MSYTWKIVKPKTGRHWVMSVISEIMKTGVKITFEICSFFTTNYLSLLKPMVTLLESFILLALSFLEPALCSVFQGTSAAIVSLDFLALVGFCSGQQAYCWDFIQTHKQQLHFYFMSLLPNSQVYDIAWSLSSSWSLLLFFFFFPLSLSLCSSFMGYRARVQLSS